MKESRNLESIKKDIEKKKVSVTGHIGWFQMQGHLEKDRYQQTEPYLSYETKEIISVG